MQALMNLLNNAYRNTKQGIITLTFGSKNGPGSADRCLAVTVSDTGSAVGGHTEDQHEFVPFNRFQKEPGKQHLNGQRLGLIITEKIVAQFGGELQWRHNLSGGTQFFFKFYYETVQEEDDGWKRRGAPSLEINDIEFSEKQPDKKSSRGT